MTRNCTTCGSTTHRQADAYVADCNLLLHELAEDSTMALEAFVANDFDDFVVVDVSMFVDGIEVAVSTVSVSPLSGTQTTLSASWWDVRDALFGNGSEPSDVVDLPVEVEVTNVSSGGIV